MTRIGSFFILAALVLAAPLVGQGSRSADATATVVITPPLSLANRRGLDFGTHFASDGVIASNMNNFAIWEGQTDANTKIAVAFTTLPAELTRVGGGADVVRISYGTTSGVATGTPQVSFDPATGLASLEVAANGAFSVWLGFPRGLGSSDLVTVDLTGTPAGTYQATIMLTVMVL